MGIGRFIRINKCPCGHLDESEDLVVDETGFASESTNALAGI